MRLPLALYSLLSLSSLIVASPYREDLVDYNLNVNQNASSPLEYDTTRPNTTYTPSPVNWRALPVYTILMDKFADGEPSNNDYFGTMFEYDYRETQLRHGGDIKGLVQRLDYLYSMGVRTIFVSGTLFLNMIWEADSASTFDSHQFKINPTNPRQCTPHLISAFWTLIWAKFQSGRMPSMQSTLTGCISWRILPLEQWVTFLHLMGPRPSPPSETNI